MTTIEEVGRDYYKYDDLSNIELLRACRPLGMGEEARQAWYALARQAVKVTLVERYGPDARATDAAHLWDYLYNRPNLEVS